jgi:hypothetical protein
VYGNPLGLESLKDIGSSMTFERDMVHGSSRLALHLGELMVEKMPGSMSQRTLVFGLHSDCRCLMESCLHPALWKFPPERCSVQSVLANLCTPAA